ncbi:MAG: radical SAM protein [Candidatus Electrothrix sp. LOE1_4_5]|nr:radical SAM protein [Candidatus Electrothrix gigas]
MNIIKIDIPNDIFSRQEPDGLQFVLRPAVGKPPHVALLDSPASDLWKKIQQHSELDIENLPGSSLNILAQLNDEGIIYLRDEKIILENGVAPLSREEMGWRDPWHYQFAMPALHSPWFALWEITDDCPLKTACHFCYRPKIVSGGPTLQQAERICEQFILNKIPWVTLLGGEPVVYPYLYEIIEQLRSMNIFVKMITNGVLINHQIASKLCDSGVHQVAVSLDGLDAENHDLNRGRGSFEKSLGAIRLLQEFVPLVSISLTVTNRVFNQLDQLPSFCAALNVPEVYISPLRMTNHTKLPDTDVGPLLPEQQEYLQELVFSLNSSDLSVINLSECSCGRSSVVIHSNGDISACPFATRHYGNVYKENFADIWAKITSSAINIKRLTPNSRCFRKHEKEISKQSCASIEESRAYPKIASAEWISGEHRGGGAVDQSPDRV